MWQNSRWFIDGFLFFPPSKFQIVSQPQQGVFPIVPSVSASSADSSMNDDDDESENESAESSVGMSEVRFVPEDKSLLDAMFQAMSECQALHPDPGCESDEGWSLSRKKAV